MAAVVALVAAWLATTAATPVPLAAGNSPGSAPAPVLTETWSHTLADAGQPVAESSPIVATLDGGGPAAVVGDRAGRLYAWHLDDGSAVPGWPVTTPGAEPVDATPSTLGSTLYVGTGDAGNPQGGGYAAYNGDGTLRWYTTVPELPSASPVASVQASLSVGTIQGVAAVAAGSLGQYVTALDASSGRVLPGFPWFAADSTFSTPSIADLYGNGLTEVVSGGDSTGNPVPVYGHLYSSGGHIRIVSGIGNADQYEPNGGLVCEYDTDQTVFSSPAIGPILSGGGVGIVVGTGAYYPAASDSDRVIAIDTGCHQAWSTQLDGITSSSPALVDALGTGGLEVTEGTQVGSPPGGGGSVYLLDAATGQVIWRVPALGQIIGSITSVDLGAGHQDLVVPTVAGVEVLDGVSGAVLATLQAGAMGFQDAPLVTDDPNGTIGLTLAGYFATPTPDGDVAQGEVVHYEVTGSDGAAVGEPGGWPMFHHDPQLSGAVALPPDRTGAACEPPVTVPTGYDEVAADGGVFTFGNRPYCGSTGALHLVAPIVGMARTPDIGGYWLAAADGGIFAFGDAAFLGSAGNLRLNSPIVGMAPTPDGGGYWLVAADGGIFTFGDAAFRGSTGNLHLNSPIVGMAPTPDGGGYWLVAADGGIFTFGDAAFRGSTGNLHLNRPVVGMSPTGSGQGYWLVAADGGIFTFGDAPFLGSTGNLHLDQPIVGMAGTASGQGYRLVAADGGVFDYGSASFSGSLGGRPLAAPVVGVASR